LEDEACYYPQARAQYERFYKASILAILGNACYGRKYFQDAVASRGGVDLLLSQCRGDMSSPLSREWALWAVRNLCEGNPEAQAAIAELKQCPVEGQQQQPPQMMAFGK
jgi:ataxin-10